MNLNTAPLRFFFHPQSRARMVRWMLEECGAEYESVPLEFGTTMKAPAYLAINPMGKVPAIRHGDTVVTENAAVCMYLADLVPEKKLAPPVGDPARGSYYRWLCFVAGPVEAASTARGLGLTLTPEQSLAAGFGSYAMVLSTLEQTLSQGPYLCAGHFTAADLYMSAWVGWGMQSGDLPRRGVFSEYAERHLQRPAALRAAQLDGPMHLA